MKNNKHVRFWSDTCIEVKFRRTDTKISNFRAICIYINNLIKTQLSLPLESGFKIRCILHCTVRILLGSPQLVHGRQGFVSGRQRAVCARARYACVCARFIVPKALEFIRSLVMLDYSFSLCLILFLVYGSAFAYFCLVGIIVQNSGRGSQLFFPYGLMIFSNLLKEATFE